MKYNPGRRLASLLFFAIFLGSCASHETPDEDDMVVDVNFLEIHRCSRISPEIRVDRPPKGTKYYDIRLMEEGATPRYLGGGVWEEDGTGIIPEGALTRHYTGPCPPADKEVEYIYAVSAMPDLHGQPLEVRLYRFKPE